MLDREDIKEINAANAEYERHVKEEQYRRLHCHEIEEDRKREKSKVGWHFDRICGGYYYGKPQD